MARADAFLPLTPLTHAILLALADGERHGYAIMKTVEEDSEGQVRAGTGTLYAALQRLCDEGLIEDADREPAPDEDARRRYFRITALGRAVARAEAERLTRVLALADRKRLGAALRGGE